jgi:predicted MFS family arabinose efflux permease
MATTRRAVSTVAVLGSAQTLAWASSYYLPAMLATPMARDLGVTAPTVFAAFSLALLMSAALGPFAGRAIDRWGGRPVLVGSNLVFALGLAGLGLADGAAAMFVAWVLIGVGMACGLYEAAFAALVRLHGHESRNLITGITLIAGFASTVGWPLSTLLETQIGWRGACFTWAGLHLLLGVPLNLALPKAAPEALPSPAADAAPPEQEPERAGRRRAALILAFVFAVTWFVSTAMAAHLPRLLQAGGATLAAAVAIGALVGPAQVGGRLLEFGVLRHVHPLLSARLAALMQPVGAALLALLGAPLAALFAILHGAGNGILTIAKGTLPLVLFGPQGYGLRQGLLMVPARVAQAAAPWLFGLLLDRYGAGALWFSSALGLTAFAALLLLPKPAAAREPAAATIPAAP